MKSTNCPTCRRLRCAWLDASEIFPVQLTPDGSQLAPGLMERIKANRALRKYQRALKDYREHRSECDG